MTTSLIQHFTSFEPHNSLMNFPRNYAIEYITEKFENKVLTMQRDSDCKCPEYLEIEIHSKLDLMSSSPCQLDNIFKKSCNNVYLQMQANGETILNIPLTFMIHLKNYEVCDDKFYITIPFQMFCDDIKLVCLKYNEFRFTLMNIDNTFKSCNLISKAIHYDSPLKEELCKNNHQHIIQTLSSTEISCVNNGCMDSFDKINVFKYKIPFQTIHKGFFIEVENVDEINKIILLLNGHDRTIYNRFLVRTKCVKINQHLLYFPLNSDKSYTDRTVEGFEGSLNLSRMDAIINIILDNPKSKIRIYGLGSNMLIYKDGLVTQKFNYVCRHDYEEYKPKPDICKFCNK